MSTDSSYFFFSFMCLPSAFTKTQGLLEDEVSRVKVTLVSGGSRCFISCFGSSQPRGATPHPRSGQKPGGLHARGVAAGRSYPTSEVRGGSWECQAATAQEQPAERCYPMPKIRGGGQEEQSHFQGAVTARAQEGLEELLHVQGQKWQWWGDTPRPR